MQEEKSFIKIIKMNNQIHPGIQRLPQDEIRQQKNIQKNKISIKVRNRRYKKLQQLRKDGFFSQQVIKLRHPFLYYLYVGQYSFIDTQRQPQSNQSNNLFSSFLERNLLNIEYKDLLNEYMSVQVQKMIQLQKNINEEQIQQLKRMFCVDKKLINDKMIENDIIIDQKEEQYEMQVHSTVQGDKIQELSNKLKSYQPSQAQIHSLRQNVDLCQQIKEKPNISLMDVNRTFQLYDKISQARRLDPQQQSLQEQNLIQHCEQLYLEGKITNLQQINYKLIDQNQQYDDWKQQNKDLQQKFFGQVQEQIEEGYENYYTGIQDY